MKKIIITYFHLNYLRSIDVDALIEASNVTLYPDYHII